MNTIEHGLGIELQGIEKTFNTRRVLRDITLEIPAGQFVAIVGRSGCGKSTLLRLLSGLDATTHGTINDDQGKPLEASQSQVRLMFQDSRLLPWKSVLDNVRLGLPIEATQAALDALDAVGLKDRAKDWPATLSGGQRQRIALARALVHKPRLLLLDEPLGALDALTRIEMQQLIEKLWIKQGFTVVLVTHDISEAVSVADRIILIETGRIGIDLPVNVARPRDRHCPELAAIERLILERVMRPMESSTQVGVDALSAQGHDAPLPETDPLYSGRHSMA